MPALGIFSLLLLAFSISSPALARDPISVCDYYHELSQSLGCGEENYLNAFGLRYCREFVQAQDQFTRTGEKTFHHIRNCLIDSLKAEKDLTFQNVRDRAEEHHITCYRGSGYCELGFYDKWIVVHHVWKELFDSRFRKVIRAIDADCAAGRISPGTAETVSP